MNFSFEGHRPQPAFCRELKEQSHKTVCGSQSSVFVWKGIGLDPDLVFKHHRPNTQTTSNRLSYGAVIDQLEEYLANYVAPAWVTHDGFLVQEFIPFPVYSDDAKFGEFLENVAPGNRQMHSLHGTSIDLLRFAVKMRLKPSDRILVDNCRKGADGTILYTDSGLLTGSQMYEGLSLRGHAMDTAMQMQSTILHDKYGVSLI